MKRVMTYGTFDVLHYGHLMHLKKAKELGDYLIVGVSNDEFNEMKKNKKAYYPYEIRKEIVSSIKYVDEVFEQKNFEQKKEDILKYNIDILVSSSEWKGKYDYLREYCEVIYLERKDLPYSSTAVRKNFTEDEIYHEQEQDY